MVRRYIGAVGFGEMLMGEVDLAGSVVLVLLIAALTVIGYRINQVV